MNSPVLGPTSTDPGDPEVLRSWLAEGERVLTPADPTTFEDVARWVRHFYRSEAGGGALAQEIHKRLETLCATMASLAADPDDRSLAEAVATLEIHQLDRLSQLASRLADPHAAGFGLARMKARYRLWWWRRAAWNLPTGSDSARSRPISPSVASRKGDASGGRSKARFVCSASPSSDQAGRAWKSNARDD